MTLKKNLIGIIILALTTAASWAEDDPNADLFSKKGFVNSHFKQQADERFPEAVVESPRDSLSPQPSQVAKFHEFSETTKNELGRDVVEYRPTQERPVLSAFIATEPKDTFFSGLERLISMRRVGQLNLGTVFAVGDPKVLVNHRMVKLLAGLPEGSVDIRVLPQLPKDKPYTFSPTYEVQLDGVLKVYEGGFDIGKMFDAEGRFQEPVVQ